jgi:hypothetical protein
VIATRLLISPLPARYADVEFGLLGIDIVVLTAFVAIALQSNRFWPLWAAGFQLTMSISHVLKAIDLDLLPRAYGAAAVFWSYPILLVILIGTWRTHRRQRAERQPSLPDGRVGSSCLPGGPPA